MADALEVSAMRFVLYVEGPRDRDVLRIWARRASPPLARALEPCAVILGGRQPARARAHFRKLGGASAGVRGLCVLDRDDGDTAPEPLAAEPGLEYFTWPRRHIESYLLVPDAIRRCLPGAQNDPRIERLLREHGVSGPEPPADVDAKRLLSSSGPLARALGVRLSTGRIARSMRKEDLHADVLALFERLRVTLGLVDHEPSVVSRRSGVLR